MPALTRRNLSIVLAITAALCITRGSLAADVAPPASAPTSQPTGQSQLDKKLDQKLPQVKLSQTALGYIVDFLRDITGLNIALDVNALRKAGVGIETPMTLELKDKTIRQGLDALVKQVDQGKGKIAFGVVDDEVRISTVEALKGATTRKS